MPEQVTTDPLTPCQPNVLYFFVLLYSVMLGVVPDESIQIDATLHSTMGFEAERRRGEGGSGGRWEEGRKLEVSGITNTDKTTLGCAPSGWQFPLTQVPKAHVVLKRPP